MISTAALLALVAGCATHGYDKGAAAASTLQEAANRVARGQEQLDITLAALKNLTEAPAADLRPQFKRFSQALSKLQSVDKDVTAQRQKMNQKGDAYFKVWDQELAKITNEDIRTRSGERRNEVTARFKKIEGSYENAKTNFAPVISDLQDIQRALATDLTASGVQAVKPAVARVSREAEPLRQAMSTLSDDFRALGLSLAPAVPTAK